MTLVIAALRLADGVDAAMLASRFGGEAKHAAPARRVEQPIRRNAQRFVDRLFFARARCGLAGRSRGGQAASEWNPRLAAALATTGIGKVPPWLLPIG